MRNAINALIFISGIAKTVGVDDLVARIAQQGKVNFTFSICSNFFRETLADVFRIDADRVEFYILILIQQRPQFG